LTRANPSGVAVDHSGNIYVTDTYNETVRKITSAGMASVFAGSPGKFDVVDGTGADARFYLPEGVAIDGAGTIYVATATQLFALQ